MTAALPFGCSTKTSVMLIMRLGLSLLLLLVVAAVGDKESPKAAASNSELDSVATTPFGSSNSAEQSGFADVLYDVDTSVTPLDEVSGELGMWPFDGKNKTHEDHSCAGHKNCFECSTSSYLCHWCGHDQACHAVGSIHGCARGADCGNHTKPPHNKDKNETACASHSNCVECALSSTLCHWCAHDQACHSVGSVYGCLAGVNCYSNDRCQRTEPEQIDKLVFPEMGLGPIIAILVVACMCCCCSSLGYCVAGGVKGAYDDLAHLAAQPSHHQLPRPISSPASFVPSMEAPARDEENAEALNTIDDNGEAVDEEETPLIPNGTQEAHDGYQLMSTDTQPHPFVNSPRRSASKHMQCLFRACTFCYVVSLAVIGALAFGSIRYYPKMPEYNVCNDAVGWKSLVDSMTGLKVAADFEILMSLMNPNHYGASLDMGRGTFKHDGVLIGHFEVPPVVATSMSITDLAIIATFTPEKWEALSLTAEYYRGTLTLEIDLQASIRVPMLANYTFEADVSGMMVHVNDPKMYDRHLCACPDWKEAKNKTPTVA